LIKANYQGKVEANMGIQRSSILEREPITELGVTNGSHSNGEQILAEFIPEARYWEQYYSYPDMRYEWNNGQLEAVPMASYAKYLMYLWFLDLLRDFLHVNPLARIIGLDTGFRMALPTKTTIRKPDLGLVLASNPVALHDEDRSYHGIFDICIESLSDSSQTEIDLDTIIKRAEYAAAGVQEYYILDDRRIETQCYQLTERGLYQPIPATDGIIRSGVLPGFQFRLQDLYDKPTLAQMVDDPVYSAFISPDLRNERQRAEQAEARADQERQRAEQAEAQAEQERQRAQQAEARAEQEHQRAEQYATLLKAAGVLP
jgi:Uma2 family endonuclease